MMPSKQQIITEITEGPLSNLFTDLWEKVFDDEEPMRTKLANRQGMLKPDAANDILILLNDPTKRTKNVTKISRGAFVAALTPVVFALAMMPDSPENSPIKQGWRDILGLIQAGDEEVNVGRAEIASLLDKAISNGLIDANKKQEILTLGGTTTQSRLEELDWQLTVEDIQSAKKVS